MKKNVVLCQKNKKQRNVIHAKTLPEKKRLENIISKKQIHNESKYEYTEKEDMSKEKLVCLDLIDKERNRLARDLHDSTVQSLNGIMYKAEYCSKLMNLDQTKAQLELQIMVSSIKGIIEELRNIIYNTRNDIPAGMTIFDYIEVYIEELSLNYQDINFLYQNNCNAEKIEEAYETTLLYVIKEGCSNIIRHSSAGNVFINMRQKGNSLHLEITDDGKGFDVHKKRKENNKSFGLYIMQERIKLLNGSIKFISSEGNGTTILVEIPKMFSEG